MNLNHTSTGMLKLLFSINSLKTFSPQFYFIKKRHILKKLNLIFFVANPKTIILLNKDFY